MFIWFFILSPFSVQSILFFLTGIVQSKSKMSDDQPSWMKGPSMDLLSQLLKDPEEREAEEQQRRLAELQMFVCMSV
jgi:hypothetical protein